MELTVRIDEELGAELYEWLVGDPGVGGTVKISPADAGAGTMGTGFDVLNLVIPNLIALSSLGVSIAQFVDGRRRSTGSAPEIRAEAGSTVVVLGADAEDVLRRLAEEGGS
ncbi:effector-associated constant component EACC1 [Actinomadura atramentaria]|uniref:effector-associated constant component EACC1 n=1 Tax=Actinomadura atramentaria TaxID=1990 RepID=UPI00037A89D3|nr:hypothetical protein [Actinomadura atramentaria]